LVKILLTKASDARPASAQGNMAICMIFNKEHDSCTGHGSRCKVVRSMRYAKANRRYSCVKLT